MERAREIKEERWHSLDMHTESGYNKPLINTEIVKSENYWGSEYWKDFHERKINNIEQRTGSVHNSKATVCCRVCLRKNMQVCYKLNSNYIALMETIAQLKMRLSDTVCCFCLTTLRRIQKFIDAAKEVDSILKLSIKTEEDENEVNTFYNLSVSPTRHDSIEGPGAPSGSYGYNVGDELPVKVECDLLEIEDVQDEPHELSEDIVMVNESESEDDVPLVNMVDNKAGQNEYMEDNESFLHEQLKSAWSKEENNKVVPQLPREEVVQHNITRKRRNKIDINDVLTKEIHKLNYMDTICSRDKPFSCDVCQYKAKHKCDLTKHLRLHTGEKPFSCNICLYKFSNKSNLREHLRIHAGEKPFSCNVCSYKFLRKGDLTRHSRIHTGEKPFACNICSYKCRRKSDLRIHLNTQRCITNTQIFRM